MQPVPELLGRSWNCWGFCFSFYCSLQIEYHIIWGGGKSGYCWLWKSTLTRWNAQTTGINMRALLGQTGYGITLLLRLSLHCLYTHSTFHKAEGPLWEIPSVMVAICAEPLIVSKQLWGTSILTRAQTIEEFYCTPHCQPELFTLFCLFLLFGGARS